jgi:ribosomal protein S18 acetylase RimI-like enzyme
MGAGSALLSYLARHAKAIGAKRIDWVVMQSNTDARRFYKETCGAEELDKYIGARVEGSDAIDKLISLVPK